MAKAFSSAAASGKRELVIKSDSQTPESSAVRSGKFADLFSVSTLNHLEINGFSELAEFPSEVGRLEGLFQLILTKNSLAAIPSEIDSLTKLKHLDVSQNKISTLPVAVYSLHSLQTLIISHNSLTDDSFPPAPEGVDILTALPNLHHVDLLNNQLTKLPDLVYKTHPIQELIASDNEIAELEPGIGSLAGLKHIDLRRNKLRSLPYEITACSKLKNMRFEENPIGDRRLLKLVTQHGASKPKAVLDYIGSHTPKYSGAAPASKGSKVKSGGKSAGGARPSPQGDSDEDDDGVVFAEKKVQIQIVRPTEHVQVTATAAARAVRPYLVCAVVRGVDLADDLTYKEFITLQTKLHDTVCKRRRVATIATHNLNAISPPLRYSCGPAPSITFTPLNTATPTTAEEFMATLEASKQEGRRGGGGGGGGKGKGKKGGGQSHAAQPSVDPVTAALSKYLQFVKAETMVFLQDKTDTVISLPPLTNSEISKINSETTDLFLEVTSSESLASCKAVMDSLVCGMCEKGVGLRQGRLALEQVRVVDETGQLLVLYPSRTDLTETSYDIIRPQ